MNPETSEEVSEKEEKEILEKLQSGEYLFGVATRTIVPMNDLQKTLYKVELESTDSLEYNWDEK